MISVGAWTCILLRLIPTTACISLCVTLLRFVAVKVAIPPWTAQYAHIVRDRDSYLVESRFRTRHMIIVELLERVVYILEGGLLSRALRRMSYSVFVDSLFKMVLPIANVRFRKMIKSI
jgi:hypothetical protein